MLSALLPAQAQTPGKTRSEVVADLIQSRADEQSPPPPSLGKTRAEVVAELVRARQSGELERLHAEGGPDHFPAPLGRAPRRSMLAGK